MKETNTQAHQFDVAGESAATEMEGKFLTFWTDSQLFGVPISDVVQIVGMQDITQIPEFPDYAKGIINLRGSIIPVIDVRLRFRKAEAAYNERTCIIVTDIGGNNIGFIVDEVDEVTEISDDMVSPPPKMAGAVSDSYLTGIGKQETRVVLLLDTARLLSEETVLLLSGGAAGALA